MPLRFGLLPTGSLVGSVAAAVTGAAASICCIGPLAITILGVQGAIWAAGIQPYRWYLLAASSVFLSVGFWSYYGRRTQGASCPTRTGRIARIILWSSTIVWAGAVAIQFVADKYWLY